MVHTPQRGPAASCRSYQLARFSPSSPYKIPVWFVDEAGNLAGLIAIIVPLLLRAVDSDDDFRAVTAAIGGLTRVLQLVPATPCQPYLADIAEASRKILAGEAICQITVDSDLEDLEDDQDDQVRFAPNAPFCPKKAAGGGSKRGTQVSE